MGSIHFYIPRSSEFQQDALACAYLVGSDGVPWESRVEIRGNQLTVTRGTEESGRMVVLWRVKPFGRLALSTGTLMPVERPYHLAVELARGLLSRLQKLLGHAESRGFQIDERSQQLWRDAIEHFIAAALNQADFDRATHEAECALECSLALTEVIGSDERVTSGIADVQARSSTGVWGTVVGAMREAEYLTQSDHLVPNVVLLRHSWRDLEINPDEWNWSELDRLLAKVDSDRLRVGCGPLVTFDRNALPDWLYLWVDDFETIHSYFMSYVQKIVRRYSGRFRFWHCSAGTNVDEELDLTEEQRLRLTVSAVETVRHTDPRTPVLVSVKQPWGEYLGRSPMDLTPMQFADILVRGDLGVAAIGLQIDVGCSLEHTLPRDLLEFNRMIESWSGLGLPLVVFLSIPSTAGGQLAHGLRWTFVRQLLQLLASKPLVHGIIWDPLVDRADWPAGLFDASGIVKPVMESFQEAAGASMK